MTEIARTIINIIWNVGNIKLHLTKLLYHYNNKDINCLYQTIQTIKMV